MMAPLRGIARGVEVGGTRVKREPREPTKRLALCKCPSLPRYTINAHRHAGSLWFFFSRCVTHSVWPCVCVSVCTLSSRASSLFSRASSTILYIYPELRVVAPHFLAHAYTQRLKERVSLSERGRENMQNSARLESTAQHTTDMHKWSIIRVQSERFEPRAVTVLSYRIVC